MNDERFWGKVAIAGADQCWPWLGGTRPKHTGAVYGVVRRDGILLHAHRYAFQQKRGTIPSGHVVMHTCDNPICCNPGHLISGTASDNVMDSVRKGRHWEVKKTSCPRGHAYDEQNTYRGSGFRKCRRCDREARRKAV